ncbi:MAG: ATP-binding protein, partial [Chloroflexota bacterium]|nr:ATP-binding protein [Chloroflexota bacterium]
MSRASRIQLARPTIRLRLTILYGSLFLVSGAVLLAFTYALVGSATSSPLVYRDPNGGLSVTFMEAPGQGGAVPVDGPAPQDGAHQTIGPNSSVSEAPGGVQPEELQTLAEQQHAAQMSQLLAWSGVALSIMAFVSVGAGWIVAGRVLQPMRTMAGQVRRMTTSSVGERLSLDGPNDELKDLGRTFNDLLDRLQHAFDAQRQFVANASHELRTPLARQRALIQVALTDPDAGVDSLRSAFDRVLEAGRQQEMLIEALFTLARGERGLEKRQPVDLAAMAERVVDLAAMAERVVDARHGERDGRELTLSADLRPATTVGDPRLLERLLVNLVDNAARYNVPGGGIQVSTSTEDNAVRLRVVNDGPPVPATEIERLFEPFHRLGADRLGQSTGWGLGLSIVRAVARAHDGSVSAVARPEGGLE